MYKFCSSMFLIRRTPMAKKLDGGIYKKNLKRCKFLFTKHYEYISKYYNFTKKQIYIYIFKFISNPDFVFEVSI